MQDDRQAEKHGKRDHDKEFGSSLGRCIAAAPKREVDEPSDNDRHPKRDKGFCPTDLYAGERFADA